MIESIRCPYCDTLLCDDLALTAGECGCRRNADYQIRDTVLNPATGYLFTSVPDGQGGMRWLELAPSAAHAQIAPPRDAVLLVRYVEGKPSPVVDLGSGDLFAVETVA